jgi:SSS family solute:Na+ symporter
VSGILAAAGSWLILFSDASFGADREYTLTIPFVGQPVMPVTAMIACSLFAMILTSWITRPPRDATVAKFFPEG